MCLVMGLALSPLAARRLRTRPETTRVVYSVDEHNMEISSARERIRDGAATQDGRGHLPVGGKVEGASRPAVHAHTSKSQLQRVRRLTKLRCARKSIRGDVRVAGGRVCGGWVKIDASKVPSTPRDKVQEVSRLAAQGVTSKSKLLAREMPRVCSRGLRVDSEAAKSLKVAPAQSGSKSMRRSSPRDLYARYRR